MKLNLGSGNDYREGWVNVDLYQHADERFDLATFPYPITENSVDEIYAAHILEHLPSTVDALEEWWRICKNGAKITVRVPHYSHIDAYSNPTHKRYFTSSTLDYFTEENWEHYGRARFRILHRQLTTAPKPTDSLFVKLHALVVNSIARPRTTERFMALLGGISEMVWEFEVVK